MSQPPLILGLVSDLLFAAPLENAVTALGCRAQCIASGEEIEPGIESAPARARPGEPLSGRGAGFVRILIEDRPALIVVELNSRAIPWADWVAASKSSAATRRIPVIAFGPHTDLELRQRALDAGCDAVVAQGRFLSALPELIEQYARRADEAALDEACRGRLSPLALGGIELFDRREFFEAHEVLENAWNQEAGPARELYRAILQVAVAYLQIERGNYSGALKMFLRLRQWLDPLPEECRGVNVAQLRSEALAARAELERLGPDMISGFNRELFRPLPMTGQPHQD